MTDPSRLGDLQLAILRVLWERGEATVADVHAALLSERSLAPTTIATMLRRLADRGVVSYRSEGRVFVYRAEVGEDEVRRAAVLDLRERLFEGDLAAVVHQLLDVEGLDRSELERLRRLIEERERELGAREGDDA